MKKLIVALFVFVLQDVAAQDELGSKEEALIEQEVKLICTRDIAYFESIINDKVQETGSYGNISCVLKTKPFANIPYSSGFVYQCYYNYGFKNASYQIKVSGSGQQWDHFEYVLVNVLKKLTREGVFEYHQSDKNKYCLIKNGSNVDPESPSFSFARYDANAGFEIFSQSFERNKLANNTSAVNGNTSSTGAGASPAVTIMTPALEANYKENMEAGDKALAASDYPAAIAKFEAASNSNPKDGKSQVMLGLAHMEYAEKLFTVNNREQYKIHDDLGRMAIIRANIRNPDNPVIMYYHWKYLNGNKGSSIELLSKIIERTQSNFREPVYSLCKVRLVEAWHLRQKMELVPHQAAMLRKEIAGNDAQVTQYKSLVEDGLRDFQFILKNYAAEPMDIFQYAGRVYLMEYKIDSAVFCFQKVKDNAANIKWINYDFEQLYETARINQVRLKHTALADVIKSDNFLRDKNFTAAIATDQYNAMAYVKRAEANELKPMQLGLEHMKEDAASHRLSVADYEKARAIYPAILQGKANEVIAFLNKWIYQEEHFNELNDLSGRTTSSSQGAATYSAPAELYNSANTGSARYETLLNCSYCRGSGEVYNPNGGVSTNTYYLLGGSGLVYQGKTYNSTYIKCSNCNGTGKIKY